MNRGFFFTVNLGKRKMLGRLLNMRSGIITNTFVRIVKGLRSSGLLLSWQSQSFPPGTLASNHGTYYNQKSRFRFSYAHGEYFSVERCLVSKSVFKKKRTRIFFLWNVLNRFIVYILNLSKWKTMNHHKKKFHRAIFLRI